MFFITTLPPTLLRITSLLILVHDIYEVWAEEHPEYTDHSQSFHEQKWCLPDHNGSLLQILSPLECWLQDNMWPLFHLGHITQFGFLTHSHCFAPGGIPTTGVADRGVIQGAGMVLMSFFIGPLTTRLMRYFKNVFWKIIHNDAFVVLENSQLSLRERSCCNDRLDWILL